MTLGHRKRKGSSRATQEVAMALGIMQATRVVLTLGLGVGLGLGGGVASSAAQGTATEVAYVEAVNGRVVAAAQGNPTLVGVLDIISDRTRLDLLANSELQICHYLTHKLLTLRGPLRASISASGVMAENGAAIAGSRGTCTAPVVSTFQGGLVSRTTGVSAMKVSLRPSIKIVNRGPQTIRSLVLWDGAHQKIVTTFDGSVARPILDDGQYYLLVVERSDGSELSTMLQTSAVIETSPLILTVR
jgi:hypothetical protein